MFACLQHRAATRCRRNGKPPLPLEENSESIRLHGSRAEVHLCLRPCDHPDGLPLTPNQPPPRTRFGRRSEWFCERDPCRESILIPRARPRAMPARVATDFRCVPRPLLLAHAPPQRASDYWYLGRRTDSPRARSQHALYFRLHALWRGGTMPQPEERKPRLCSCETF